VTVGQVGKLEQKHREAKSALDEELRAFEVSLAGLAEIWASICSA